MKKKNKVIAVLGPTGVGKTRISIQIAKYLKNAEIISCDSRQIYKEMDIVTAKPTFEEKSGVSHYLLDFIAPDEKNYSAALYVEAAQKKIDELILQNKTPVIVGGTGLYFKSLLGEFDIPKVEPDLELRKNLEQKSNEVLYEILKEKDLELSKKIHPNNKNKIIRALEVMEKLKIPMSQAQKKKETPYDVIWIGLDAENRAFLYEKINKRCECMLDNGLLNELKNLLNKYGEIDLFKATIGYKEFLPYLKNEISLSEATEKFEQHTRNYAKRQLSWFRADKNIHWFFIDKMSEKELFEGIIKLCL